MTTPVPLYATYTLSNGQWAIVTASGYVALDTPAEARDYINRLWRVFEDKRLLTDWMAE